MTEQQPPTRVGGWMVTRSGRMFWPLDPRPEDFDLGDIMHALSMICRYGGHTRDFYSVAQHSVLVSEIAESLAKSWAFMLDDPWAAVPAKMWALIGLMHDAPEAYIGDMVRPLKRSVPVYYEIEHKIQRALEEHLRLPVRGYVATAFEHPLIVKADNMALLVERRDLLTNPSPHGSTWAEDDLGLDISKFRVVFPYAPEVARDEFLLRLNAVR